MKNIKQIIENSFRQRNFIIIALSFLFFLTNINTVFAVDRKIDFPCWVFGKVTDLYELPLKGVVVTLKNSKIHTETDENGKYWIEFPDIKNQFLIFSSTGYLNKEVSIDSITLPILNITLEYATSETMEVLVYRAEKAKANLKQAWIDFMEKWFTIIIELKELTKKELTKKGTLSFDQLARGRLLTLMHSSNFEFYTTHLTELDRLGLGDLKLRLAQHLKELAKVTPDDL